MGYSQFINMIPECYLVSILLIVFFMSLSRRVENDKNVFAGMTLAMVIALPFRIALISEPAEAFGCLPVGT